MKPVRVLLILLVFILLLAASMLAAPAMSQEVRQGETGDPELVAQCMFACSSNSDCAARYPDIQRYCAEATRQYPDPVLWDCLAGYPATAWDQAFAACAAR